MKEPTPKNKHTDALNMHNMMKDTSCQGKPDSSFVVSCDFSKKILDWYAFNKRSLPWRDIQDPYRIWISEIILQQTRIVQGYDYYLRFLKRFPDVQTLAKASEDEVLQQWEGLGYYSRARNLHAAAQTIASLGSFPKSYEAIRQLKGVGDYTAAAISSFAYGLPTAVVDGNVYRVLARYFGIETPIDTAAGKQQFRELAQLLLDVNQPGEYNQALMDFGALQCTPKKPHCNDCPLLDTCLAKAKKQVDLFPFKSKRMQVKTRYFVYLYVRCQGKIFLHHRDKGDIWQGLYEPPLFEFDHPVEFDEVVKTANLSRGAQYRLLAKGLKHVLTHRILLADCYEVKAPVSVEETLQRQGCIAIPESERSSYAVPRLVPRIYELIDAPSLF